MLFDYKAKSKTGDASTGVVEATSVVEARQLLRVQGLFPLSLSENKGTSKHHFTLFKSSISKRDLLLMTTQLSIMQKSGLDLAEALKGVSKQVSNPLLAKSVSKILHEVEEGKSFSSALHGQSHIFGDAYVASIAAGEASGNLGEVLGRLTDLLRNEVRLSGTIRSIATYPIVLLTVALAVVNALIFFVLPQFGEVFKNLDSNPPFTTQMLLAFGELVRANVLIIAGALFLAGIGAIQFVKSNACKRSCDTLILEAGMIRKATRSLLTGRMFRLIGTMLQSGVPLLEAIQLCRRSIKNVRYQELFDRFENEVINGNGLAMALSSSSFVPEGAAQMIATAEQSGDLGGVMETVGEFYEDEGERHVRDLASMLEPMIIVVMGGVVAVVVMSVILPLLDLSSTSAL